MAVEARIAAKNDNFTKRARRAQGSGNQGHEALHGQEPGGQDSSLYGNGRHGSGRRRTYKVLLRDMRTSDRRTTPSAEVLSYDSIRTHDGDLHMALPSSTGRHAGTVMGSRVPEYATTLPHLLSCPTVWFDDRSDSHSA